MWIQVIIIYHLLAQRCSGIHFIDLPLPESKDVQNSVSVSQHGNRRQLNTKPHLVRQNKNDIKEWLFRSRGNDDTKDIDIKAKIATLVMQTVHDTDVKVKSIANLKTRNREFPPYKIGFILSMIKKARDVLNELFNVAVKHRDEWKALEQLKIFELIVHTNVDTTNLVRQLVEIHIQHMNTTGSVDKDKDKNPKRRVVLL